MEMRKDPHDTSPGPLRDDKTDEASPEHLPQPEAAEVESARLLANKTRDALRRHGLDQIEVRRLAGRFIAEDRGQDPDVFIVWARDHRHLADLDPD
jgi:hypothetical protein